MKYTVFYQSVVYVVKFFSVSFSFIFFFFFNDTATTEIYTLSLHDALPICDCIGSTAEARRAGKYVASNAMASTDRKSTRLNSSHSQISYAVFCLKKKKNINNLINLQYQS